MNEERVKKRGWVKNAAIAFLAVMVVLTFFSNDIMNRSLPEVAATYTTSGTITARIRGSGTVTANESFEVMTAQRRTVSEVLVRVGDTVSTGDVLITLTGSASEELQAAHDALHELELRLERMLLEMSRPDGALANSNRAIAQARSDLTEAQRARDRIPYSEAAINQAQSALNQAQATLNQAQTTLNQALAGLIQPQAELDAAQAVLAAREADVANAREWLSWLLVETPGATDDITQARQALADAEAARDAARGPVDVAQAAYDLARVPVDNAQLAVTVAQAAVDECQMQLNTQIGYRNEWISANDLVRMRQQTLEQLIADQSLMQGGANIDNSLEAITLRELRREIQEKKEEIESLEKDGRSTEITALVSGVVKSIAPNVLPGRPIENPDEPLMIIEVIDRGYSLTLNNITADQASRVAIGEIADVDRGWWSPVGTNVIARLVAIRNDPQNPTTGRILVFDITGDVESGTPLNLVLSQRSETYNVVVPNSAIRTDTNGTFVLLVVSRTSPLGNRFVATRVDVNVLASDDTHTAVSGGLTGWDFVITTSAAPIDPGMQVRLADNT